MVKGLNLGAGMTFVDFAYRWRLSPSLSRSGICAQGGMGTQFFLDECGDHRSINLLDDRCRSAVLIGQCTHLADDLLDTRWGADIRTVFFEVCRLSDEAAALSDEVDHGAIDLIDALAYLFKGFALHVHMTISCDAPNGAITLVSMATCV